jgi:hypothetical protein
MIRIKYEILMQRFCITMTESGAFPNTITDAELLEGQGQDPRGEDRQHGGGLVVSIGALLAVARAMNLCAALSALKEANVRTLP